MNLASLNFLRLDPRHFKAFIAAAHCGNFSQAAIEAAMTQSGISQHISKLEEQLGAPLFLRTTKSVTLTEAGQLLQKYVEQYTDSIGQLMENIATNERKIEGLVSYAMPPSCLLSPHFPMLLERRRDYPGLELKVELMPNQQVIERVIDGDMHFGFVTEKVEHQFLCYEPFCEEEYIAVAASDRGFTSLNENNLIDQPYIHYPGMGVYFNYWVQHVFPNVQHVSDRSLHHAGDINNISGAILMVAGGLGISVFPRHCVQEFIDRGQLVEYSTQTPLMNPIYIVHRNQPPLSARVQTVIQWFMDMQESH